MRLRLLCPEPQNYSARGLELAARWADVDAETLSQPEFEARAPDYDGWMVRLQLRVTEELVERSPRLRVILTPTTGLDHIATAAAAARGVTVISLRGETEFLRGVASTAEHTWGLLLALVRRIPAAAESVRRGEWAKEPYRGMELRGKTLGIVGYGRLGSMVAEYGLAFGMRVIAFDPFQRVDRPGIIQVETLDELLAAADVLTIHVPLDASTTGMIGAREIALLPRGAVILNTSRGAIVEEGEILRALQEGRIAGAAVDVLSDELRDPGTPHPMIEYARGHDELLITPHIGGATREAIETTDAFIVDRFAEWLGGRGK